MPVEAWIALFGSVSVIVLAVLGAGWKLSGQFAAAITRFEVIDVTRATEISRINIAVEKIEITVQQIAVDRERAAALERRVGKLEQWYDELRRGVGKIEPAARA